MSQITDYAARVKTKLDTLVSEIKGLQTLIVNFQNSPGTLAPADQAALDAIEAQVGVAVDAAAPLAAAVTVPAGPAAQ